jgi:hypothetical protein
MLKSCGNCEDCSKWKEPLHFIHRELWREEGDDWNCSSLEAAPLNILKDYCKWVKLRGYSTKKTKAELVRFMYDTYKNFNSENLCGFCGNDRILYKTSNINNRIICQICFTRYKAACRGSMEKALSAAIEEHYCRDFYETVRRIRESDYGKIIRDYYEYKKGYVYQDTFIINIYEECARPIWDAIEDGGWNEDSDSDSESESESESDEENPQ